MTRASMLLALALAAGACIPSDEPAPARTPVASPDAQPGGELRVAIAPPDGIDPGNANEPSGELVARTMCDQLISFDPITGAPRPALAESWSVIPGGEKLFVKLRRGIRFSNGREVTAEDVVYTLSRVASERYASRSASLLEQVAGFPFVHGDAEAPNERARRELAGVNAADSRTVEITLVEPRADFFRVLGHPALSPVPREEVERDPTAFTRQPVCVGPYVMAAPWRPGDDVVLERAPDYWAEHPAYTRGGAGYADRITFVVTDDSDADLDVDLARAPGAEGPDVVSRVGTRLELLGLPTTTPPFDARAVRVALSLALDRETLARAHPTARVPATGLLPPAIDEAFRADACGQNAPRRGDVARGRSTLRAAGAELEALTITYNEELGNRATAMAIATMWEDAFDVTVTLQPRSFEQLLQKGQSTTGLTTPFRYGWAPEVPSADAMLVPLFSFNAIGRNNLSRFGSGDFTDAIDDAREASNDEDRVDAYRRAEDIVCGEMPMIPLTLDVETWRARDGIATAVEEWLSAAEAQPILRELWVGD